MMLACARIPAIVVTAEGLQLPDTPDSLMNRGMGMKGSRCVAQTIGSGDLGDWRGYQDASGFNAPT